MFETMVDFFSYGVQNLFNLVTLLSSSITYGINFIISTFLIIPNVILDLLAELPTFMKQGLTGVLGGLLFVLIIKIVALILLKGWFYDWRFI